ncbi:MAG TPA: CvpA family protein [Ktedonobacteraceae bacterium]|nr:CvpA family protein [Ktedonobacteraceae bacterium]
MTWQLTPLQFFLIAILAFGIVGFQRGWRREVVSLAFTLTGILFLTFGSQGLAEFVYIHLPRALSTLTTGIPGIQPATSIPPDDPRVAIAAAITFLLFIILGFLVSNRVAQKPAGTSEKLFGVIPGIIGGYAIMTFLSKALTNSSLLRFDVYTPDQRLIGSYLLVIFIIIVVVVVLALISASVKKSGGASPKK